MYRQRKRFSSSQSRLRFRRRKPQRQKLPGKVSTDTEFRPILLREAQRKKQLGFFVTPVPVGMSLIYAAIPLPTGHRTILFIHAFLFFFTGFSALISGFYYERCHDDHPDLSISFDQIGEAKWPLDTTWKRLWEAGREYSLYRKAIYYESSFYTFTILTGIATMVLVIVMIASGNPY